MEKIYEKPSVAADTVLFTIRADARENYRKLPSKKLSVLLVKRGADPFKDEYALPGGFVGPNETVEQAAYRELAEETGVSDVRLTNLSVFSDMNRDPRGWIISCSFIGLTFSNDIVLRADSDAIEAKWFALSYKCVGEDKVVSEDEYRISKEYILELKNEDEILEARVEVMNSTKNYHRTTTIKIIESDGIAFDHAKIIASAIYELRNNIDTAKFAFDLLPEKFTLSDLQTAYEIVLDTKLLVPNFRRKISECVIETDESIIGAGHRPAKLYKRNMEVFV